MTPKYQQHLIFFRSVCIKPRSILYTCGDVFLYIVTKATTTDDEKIFNNCKVSVEIAK